MSNKLIDLNNHLFDTIEFLSESKNEEAVQREISKAKAICEISKQIIDIHKLALDAAKYSNPAGIKPKDINSVFSLKDNNEKIAES